MPDSIQTTLFKTSTADVHSADLGDAPDTGEGGEATELKWIGSFPPDWDTAPLAELAHFITKGSTPTTFGFDWVEDGTLFLRSECVSKDGFNPSGAARISEEAHQALSRSVVQAGDILMTITGYVGTVCRFPDLGETANINQHIARIRIDSPKADCDFVLLMLSMLAYRQRYERIATGQAYPQISLTQVRETPIALPPLPEQRKIARILGAWDRALADLDALIEAKRRRKRGLAQRLLTGRVRLRGFGCAEMVETKIGTVPSDWREVRFGKVFKRQSEKNESSAIKRVITVGKYAIRPQSEHFDKSVASADLSNYNVIRPGDFVYDPMSAYYGAIGRYDYEEPGIVSPVYRVLKLRRGFDSGFIKHLLKAHYVRHRIASYSTQGNKEGKRRGLQHVAFKAIPIFVPTEEEQRRIAGVLDAADAELAALDAQRDALAHQKRGLMQRLLTGEVRVTPDNEDYHIAESECNA